MVLLIDALTVLLTIAIGLSLYMAYYHIFILGYVKKVSSAMAAGEHEKAQVLIRRALKRQPKRMSKLFARNGIGTMR